MRFLNVILTRDSYRFLVFLATICSVIAGNRKPTDKGFVPSFPLKFAKQLNEEASLPAANDIMHNSFEQAPRPSRNSLRVIRRNFNPVVLYLTTTPHSTAPMSDSAPAPATVTQPIYDSTISTSVTYTGSATLTYSVTTPRASSSPILYSPLMSILQIAISSLTRGKVAT